MLDLFSGIGGFSLAAQWVWGDELEIVGFCEMDKYCQKVLRKNFGEHIPIYDRIEDLTYEQIIADTASVGLWGTKQECNNKEIQSGGRRNAIKFNKTSEVPERTTEAQIPSIDLITGGFPCQPFSVAGLRKGKEDDRYLWHEMLRVITEASPKWVICENVANIVNMALDDVLSDLEGQGYTTETFVIPACAIGARHRRDRVWIMGYSIGDGYEKRYSKTRRTKRQSKQGGMCEFKGAGQNDADTTRIYAQGFNGRSGQGEFGGSSWWAVEPNVGRVANGIPHRVDRLKGLGNAIVPQVVVPIMQAINEIESK